MTERLASCFGCLRLNWFTDSKLQRSASPLRLLSDNSWNRNDGIEPTQFRCKARAGSGSFDSFPADDVDQDADAYLKALETLVRLATAEDTLMVTAILEAGRRSLDAAGTSVQIQYAPSGEVINLS